MQTSVWSCQIRDDSRYRGHFDHCSSVSHRQPILARKEHSGEYTFTTQSRQDRTLRHSLIIRISTKRGAAMTARSQVSG